MKQLFPRGKRIRPTDKDLVFHTALATLFPVFLLVVLLFHIRQIAGTNWQEVSLSQIAQDINIPYLLFSMGVAGLVCLTAVLLFWRYRRDEVKQLIHRQKLARMVLENKWYESEQRKEDAFFKDLSSSRSKETITYFPKIYYRMKQGLLHIRVEITLGKYQEQLLHLEKKLESGLYCELTDKELKDSYVEYTLLYDTIANRISIEDVQAKDGRLRLMENVWWEYDKLPHMLIAGGTGGGKTYFILTLIEALLRTNAVLFVLDPKNADLADLQAVMPDVYYKKEDMLACIDRFYEEMMKRSEDMKLMENYRTGENYAYLGLPANFLIFDEYVAFMEMLGTKENAAVLNKLKQIVMLGRQAGFFLILACQRPDAKYLGDGIRDQFNFRVALGRMSEMGYGMMFGETTKDFFLKQIKGRGYVDVGTSVISEFYTPLVSNRGVQIDRQQPNNRAESHGTQGIFPYPACVNKALKVDIRFFRQEGFSLNEETWVRDIKEKRESYGISQQKLALAAGITRPYLSDIETGKAHPSEVLQEAITEALERFNPDAPLEMLFDYVRIRFPTTDVKHIVEDVLRLKLPYFIHEDYGFYSYTEHYYLGDIFVLVSPELEKGVLLELKGRGCRQFESYLLAQERSWYEFFMDVLMEDGVMKRLDLAINDKTGILNIPHLTEKCRNEECISVFRSFKSYRSGELVRREEKECMGNTLYIGSLQSEVYFCIYEKDYEQYKKHDIPIADAEVKNRFEIRLKNERAFYAIRDLLEHDNPERTAFQIINRYVRFVDRDDTKPRSDWRISEEWAWFIGEHRGSLKLTTKPEPYSFERTLHWLSHQVAPTLKLALRLDKMNHTQIVHDIITHAKLTEKHEKILKQQAAAAKEVVL